MYCTANRGSLWAPLLITTVVSSILFTGCSRAEPSSETTSGPVQTLAVTQTAILTPTDARTLTAVLTPTAVVRYPRGYLTTPRELSVIQEKAAQDIEPYRSAVAGVLSWANQSWNFRLDANVTCPGANDPAWNDNGGGTPILYSKALAYRLTGESRYAEQVKNILKSIITEVKTISLDDEQCQLNFSWGTPEIVASADLIEDYWEAMICTGPASTLYTDTTIVSGPCKVLFQNWLVKNPYYVVSDVAEISMSNWGTAATNATAYIADYVWDRPDVRLVSRNSATGKEIALTPGEAYAHANQLAIDRMNGYGVAYGNYSCDYLGGSQQSNERTPVKSQITESGIVPEDARREQDCNILQYNGAYQNYPQLHLGNNIQQCELMLRRGDRACYDNVDNTDMPDYTFVDPKGVTQTTHLYPGRGSIERAIKAILVDSHTEWRHDAALAVAYRYYYVHHTLAGIESWPGQIDTLGDCGQDICFGVLTHGFAPGENPGLPPTVPPPPP